MRAFIGSGGQKVPFLTLQYGNRFLSSTGFRKEPVQQVRVGAVGFLFLISLEFP